MWIFIYKIRKKDFENELIKESFISEHVFAMNNKSIYGRSLFKPKFYGFYNNKPYNFPINIIKREFWKVYDQSSTWIN